MHTQTPPGPTAIGPHFWHHGTFWRREWSWLTLYGQVPSPLLWFFPYHVSWVTFHMPRCYFLEQYFNSRLMLHSPCVSLCGCGVHSWVSQHSWGRERTVWGAGPHCPPCSRCCLLLLTSVYDRLAGPWASGDSPFYLSPLKEDSKS